MELNSSDIISGLSLLLSAYATYKIVSFNKKQKSLIESQEKLNNLLLAKELEELTKTKIADLSASFIKLGSSQYRLKIGNKGPSIAQNIKIEFPNENDVILESELEEKFPLECLDVHQCVELIAAVSMDTPRKQTIRLIWQDSNQEYNEKLVYLTI